MELLRAWVIIGLCAVGAIAAPPPEQVPTFTLRARVAQVGGKSPEASKLTVHLGSASATLSGPAWSEWLAFDRTQVDRTLKEYPAIYLDRWPVVVHLSFDGVADPTLVEAELKFDREARAIPLRGELMGPSLGLLVWREGSDEHAAAATMAVYNQRYWKAIEDVQLAANLRPKHFAFVDRFIGGDDDRIDWREGIFNLARAGFSAVMVPPSKPIRSLLLESGVKRTAWAVYSPPGYAFENPLNPNDKPFQTPAGWAAELAKPYLEAGYAPTDLAAIAMADEPGWYYPGAFKMLELPAAAARFHSYLQAQGLKPQDVGATSWDEVKPIGRSGAKDRASRVCFYWTTRFFAWDSARYFANCTRALEGALYPGIPLTTNWNFFSGRLYVPGPVANNADRKSPDAAMGGHDWLEFGRMRGCTMLWTEDWFSDAQAYQWSFYASKLRCAAEKGGISFGGYVVPRAAGDRDDGLLQKILCLVGSGAKGVNTYVFGPEYNFPGNCYSDRPNHLRKFAEAFGMIGRAEDVLWPGKRPRPQVAILSPKSSEMWDSAEGKNPTPISDATNVHLNSETVDYMAEVADLYLALEHANIPTDFVEEEDLTPAGLAAYRVLYLTEPDVPEEFQKGLVEWVRSGGILVTVPGAGRHDRYGDACHILADLDSNGETPYPRTQIANLASLRQVGTLKLGAGTAPAFGARAELGQPGNKPIAMFDDNAAATVRTVAGKGSVTHFAWFPGISYARTATTAKGRLPSGYSDLIREAIVTPAREAGVSPPVITDHAIVETPLLISDAGAAVTLLNWNNEPIEKLMMTVRVPFIVKSVQSVSAGAIPFTVEAGEVHFSLPLRSADIVSLKP